MSKIKFDLLNLGQVIYMVDWDNIRIIEATIHHVSMSDDGNVYKSNDIPDRILHLEHDLIRAVSTKGENTKWCYLSKEDALDAVTLHFILNSIRR